MDVKLGHRCKDQRGLPRSGIVKSSRSFVCCSSVHLNDSHAEAGLLGELLPDVTGGLRSLAEGSLEDLKLLGLDGGARAPSLAARLLGGPVLSASKSCIRIASEGS